MILIGGATHRLSDDSKKQMIRTLTTLSLFSILFTTVGTILGGIWADQSWGRFWGWDPKENGALLIVLWLIWVIHGKIAGQISELLWLGGMAMLSVMVGTAWIGVNLLGVGLHSYGFINGVFWGLGIFTALEILLIGGLIYANQQQGKSHAA
jgi:cytochrome c biogenesis factor